MTEKEFKYFKARKELEMREELEAQQNTLARMPHVEEKIRKKHQSEISIAEAQIEEDELEKRGRDKERKTLIWTSRISTFVAILTFLAVTYFSWSNNEIQLRPRFNIRTESYFPNTASSSLDLIIENQDGICTGFKAEVLTFAQIVLTKESINKNYLLPVEGYFSVSSKENCGAKFTDHFTTNNGMGGKYSFEDYNDAKFNSLSGKFNSFVYQKGILGFILPPSHFVKIKYQDRLGKERVYYQQVSSLSNDQILEKNWDELSLLL